MKYLNKILISLVLLSTLACDQEYRRPSGDHNLGEVQDLLYSRQLVRDRQMLVTRDQKGWAAMSTQCSHDGCELSYQDEKFLCLCCDSSFDHDGHVLGGPAKNPLPHFAVRYVDGKLYADSAKIVSEDTRYTTPELEKAISALGERIRKEGTRSGMRIPAILLGRGDGEEAPEGMFIEKKLPTPEPEE